MAVKIPRRLRDLQEYRSCQAFGYVVFGFNDGAGNPDATTQIDLDAMVVSGISLNRISWVDLGPSPEGGYVGAHNVVTDTFLLPGVLCGELLLVDSATEVAITAGELIGICEATNIATAAWIESGEHIGSLVVSNLQMLGSLAGGELEAAGTIGAGSMTVVSSVSAGELDGALTVLSVTAQLDLESGNLAGILAGVDVTTGSALDAGALNQTDSITAGDVVVATETVNAEMVGIVIVAALGTSTTTTASDLIGSVTGASLDLTHAAGIAQLVGALTAPALASAATCSAATLTGALPLAAASLNAAATLSAATLSVLTGPTDDQWVQGTFPYIDLVAEPGMPAMWLRKQAGVASGYFITTNQWQDGDTLDIYCYITVRRAVNGNYSTTIFTSPDLVIQGPIPNVRATIVGTTLSIYWNTSTLLGTVQDSTYLTGSTLNSGATSYTSGVV